MDPITQQLAKGAAAGSSEYVAVDDLYQTVIWHGNGNSSRDIPVAHMDLTDGKSLVWVKSLESSHNHFLTDNSRGMTRTIKTNGSGNQQSISNAITAFNATSFSVGNNDAVNSSSNYRYCGMVFKKQEHFFDIVQYVGNGDSNGKVISHNLGSKPGFMMIKNLGSNSTDWAVWHHTQFDKYANFNTNGFNSSSSYWANTDPNASTFKVGTSNNVNESGKEYIAYLFGHNQAVFGPDSDETIITCGSYTGSGSTEQLVNIGWEPQWLLIKKATSGDGWNLFQGVDSWKAVGEGDSSRIMVENNGATNAVGKCHPDARGFRFRNESSGQVNQSGATYIYVAIRRPNRIPENPQHVFYSDYKRGTGGYDPRFAGCKPEPDFVLYKENQNGTDFQMSNRYLGNGRYIPVSNNLGRQTDTNRYEWRRQGGFGTSGNADGTRLAWMFRRARKFCDVVHWYGTGSNQTIPHNLGGVPKLVWVCPSTPLRTTIYNFHSGGSYYMHLKNGSADYPLSSGNIWNGQDPTASNLYLGSSGDVNQSNVPYHAYLFGDCPGISKIGTYSGSTSDVTVTTGFSPRAVWIKNLSTSAHWWFCNTQTGIVNGGADNAFMFSGTDASTNSYDIIDTTSTGFVVQNTNADWNGNGNTYLYMAIAA